MRNFKSWVLTDLDNNLITMNRLSLKKFFKTFLGKNLEVEFLIKTSNTTAKKAKTEETLTALEDDEDSRDAIKNYLESFRNVATTIPSLPTFSLTEEEIQTIVQYLNINNTISSRKRYCIKVTKLNEDNSSNNFEIELFQDKNLLDNLETCIYKNISYEKTIDGKFFILSNLFSRFFNNFNNLMPGAINVAFRNKSHIEAAINKIISEGFQNLYENIENRTVIFAADDIQTLLGIKELEAPSNVTQALMIVNTMTALADTTFTPIQKKNITKSLDLLIAESNPAITSNEVVKLLRKVGHKKFKIVLNDVEIKFDGEALVYPSDTQRCEQCNSFVTNLYETPFGKKICLNCLHQIYSVRSNRVGGYHSGGNIFRPQNIVEDGTPSSKVLYGLEMEGHYKDSRTIDQKWTEKLGPIMFGQDNHGVNLAKIEHDGSVSGGDETITQPLSKQFLLSTESTNSFKSFFDAWSELYRTSEATGLHIHVDKNKFTPEYWGKILYSAYKHRHTFSENNIWRGDNSSHYCDFSNLGEIIQRRGRDFVNIFNDLCASSCHYNAISISSHTGKTVEFRYFNGTHDYNQIMKDIKSLMILLDNADALVDAERLILE